MTIKSVFILSIILCVLTACNITNLYPNSEPSDLPTLPPTSLPFPTSQEQPTLTAPESIPPTAMPASVNQIILNRAAEVIQNLKSEDFISLSGYVHPNAGVRFSPYAYSKDTDQIFSADEISQILTSSNVYTWGAYAGTGEPIDLSFPAYYAKFIYDQDFANAPQMALNHRLSSGNSIDNSAEFYPGSKYVEYYFSGFDPQYGGMDWRSLRLVFSEYDGTWYLVGVVHDEWTP